MKCYLCQSLDHFARECPHHDAITNLISRRNDGKGKKGKGRGNGHGGTTQVNTTSTSGTSSSSIGAANDNANADKPASQETAMVASAFLSSDSHTADVWPCESGASSSMSNDGSAFLSLKLDRRPICLADGKVIYSRDLGLISFLFLQVMIPVARTNSPKSLDVPWRISSACGYGIRGSC